MTTTVGVLMLVMGVFIALSFAVGLLIGGSAKPLDPGLTPTYAARK